MQANAPNVLVVDDDHDFYALLREHLEGAGFETWHAPKISDARQLMTRLEVDALIVDGLLPDGDGEAFIQSFRDRGGAVPVIFLSAFRRDAASHFHMIDHLGVSHVLRKPINPDEVVRHVAQVVPLEAPVPELEDKISALRASYVAKLDGEVERLRSAALLRDAAGLCKEAHRLAGTSGSFGLTEFSEAMRIVEELVRDAESICWGSVERAIRDAAEIVGFELPPLDAVPLIDALRLLVADGSGGVSARLRREAGEDLEIIEVRTITDALDKTRFVVPDAALIDLDLPDGGAELAQLLKDQGRIQTGTVAFFAVEPGADQEVRSIYAGGSMVFAADAATEAILQTVDALSEHSRRARVLVVDDDEDLCALVDTMLSPRGFVVDSLADPERVLDKVEDFEPDVILVDLTMPHFDGLEVCRSLRANPVTRDVELVMLTGRTSDAARIAAFRAGVDDYLEKPVAGEELVARLNARLARREQREARDSVDPVTGLLSRDGFVEELTARLSAAAMGTYSVIRLDLQLEPIETRHGRVWAQRAVRALGRVLERRFRSVDLRARLSGGRFVVALPGISSANVERLVEAVMLDLDKIVFETERGERMQVVVGTRFGTFSARDADVDAMLLD